MSINPYAARIPVITLAHRLRIAREWRGLDQVDVARELGVSRATISNYERELTRPGKLVVNAWAVVCDVDVEWLKNGDVNEESPSPDGEGLPDESFLSESNRRPFHYE